MPQALEVQFHPRKTPVQARSAASVDAILEATAQVLVQIGRERLTTTRVAHRAGVSVGTLYQYFPNKSALLQAALRRHLEDVTGAVEVVCAQQAGASLQDMAAALVLAFLEAKLRNVRSSMAFYAVSSDLDVARILEEMRVRSDRAIGAMLRSAAATVAAPIPEVVFMVQGMLVGVSRRLLESPEPEKHVEGVRRELIRAVSAYLAMCSASE